jgi:nicotinate-nucleotide pyrophosphorylase (carboxylating)
LETIQLTQRSKNEAPDIRDTLFSPLGNRLFTAQVVATECGVLAHSRRALAFLQELGCECLYSREDGTLLQPDDVILSFRGTAKQVAIAEDRVLGAMMVPSGYATRARQLQLLAGPSLRVVCGGWKKLPQEAKPGLHAALAAAGVGMRMVEGPFVYIDKNYVRMFGGVAEALKAASQFPDRKKVIQVRGEWQPIAEEARDAVHGRADVIMVDTGSLKDLETVFRVLDTLGAKHRIQVAFAGGIKEETILLLRELPVDLVDVGGAILNAPLLDMRVEVVDFS